MALFYDTDIHYYSISLSGKSLYLIFYVHP